MCLRTCKVTAMPDKIMAPAEPEIYVSTVDSDCASSILNAASHQLDSEAVSFASVLASWVVRHGGSINGVEAGTASTGGGNGIFASRDLEAGDVILALPARLVLTERVAGADKDVAAVMEAAGKDGLYETLGELSASDVGNILLVLFLMKERVRAARGKDSFWAEYVRALPSEFWTPLGAEGKVREWLKKLEVGAFVEKVREELLVLWREFFVPYAIERFPEVWPAELVDFDMFFWAFSASETRSFAMTTRVWEEGEADDGVQGEDEVSDDSDALPITSMTPFLDFMNHSCANSGVNVTADGWFPPGVERIVENKGLYMHVKKPVKKGEQLFISYGQLDNSTLLAHHGFAVRKNPADKITLILEEPEDIDRGTGLKRVMLMALVDGVGFDYELTVHEPLPRELLASLRILYLSARDLEDVTFRNDFFNPLSVENERVVLKVLDDMLRLLANLPGSLPRTAGASSGQRLFEEFCDIYLSSRRNIISRSIGKVDALKKKSSNFVKHRI